MIRKPSKMPFVRLPYEIDLVLLLIREELKSHKHFDSLYHAGLDDCIYQPHLAKLILAKLELDDGSDATFEFFSALIEKRAKKIQPDIDSIMTQTVKVYVDLMIEKKRRKSS